MKLTSGRMLISNSILPLLLIIALSACGSKKKDKDIPQESLSEEKQEEQAPVKKGVLGPYAKQIPIWAKMNGIQSSCEGKKTNLAVPINIIAENLSKDSLAYNKEPYSDCSGIFLRVLDSLEKRCPKQIFPDPVEYRDSRALARWYHEQGRLIRVTEPLKMINYLRPGVVMFYGGRGTENIALSLDDLFDHGGINHVGVITSVEKDSEGIAQGYALFHGQRPGKLASITKYHKRTYRNRPEYPPYGNGTEQWVAVASIVDTDDPLFKN